MMGASLIALSAIPAVLLLVGMAWSTFRIVNSIRAKQGIRTLHCLVLIAGFAVISGMALLILTISAALSHSEAMKDRIPCYWLFIFAVFTGGPAIALYLLKVKYRKKR